MASHEREVHHVVPRCLLTLRERAESSDLDGAGIQAWVEWELEAMRWRVPVEIDRSDLERLVESSEVVLEKEKHRILHEGDWRRWGARGGRETLRRRLVLATGLAQVGANHRRRPRGRKGAAMKSIVGLGTGRRSAGVSSKALQTIVNEEATA